MPARSYTRGNRPRLTRVPIHTVSVQRYGDHWIVDVYDTTGDPIYVREFPTRDQAETWATSFHVPIDVIT